MSLPPMTFAQIAEQYVQPLLAGDRAVCRRLMDQALESGISPQDLLNKLIWPTMEMLQSWVKSFCRHSDRLGVAGYPV